MIYRKRMQDQILHGARELLEQAWVRRFEQDLERTHLLAAEIRHLLADAGSTQFDLQSELTLLDCSLSRADRDTVRAAQLLNSVETEFRHRGIRPNAPLYLQRGLTFLSGSDYSAALEQFLGARAAARNPHEKFWSLGNALLCMEFLGLPYEHTLNELQELAKTLPLNDASLSQIQCLAARQLFREGRLDFLKTELKFKSIQQIHYYRLWVQALPFVAREKSADSLENFLLKGHLLYQYPYRARTLQGLWHNDDARVARWSELTDRLYLWTWRWLKDPDTFPFERLEPLLEQLVEAGSLLGKLSPEEFQMMRNALGWLGLFDLSSHEALTRALQAHRPTFSADHPLFGFESQLQNCLRVARDDGIEAGRLELETLRNHPLWTNDGLEFESYAEVFSEELSDSAFVARMRLWISRGRPEKGVSVHIDLTTGEVQTVKPKKQKILSASLAKAIDLLQARPLVPYAEFVRVCFGYYRYDSVVHELKILNLLARAREVLPPGFQLGVKAAHVRLVADAAAWKKIRIERAHPHASKLLQSPAWKRLLSRTADRADGAQILSVQLKPQLLLRQLQEGQEITRRELERLTGKSRATSNRLIAQWVKSGFLKPVGNAKNTKYQIRLMKESKSQKGKLG